MGKAVGTRSCPQYARIPRQRYNHSISTNLNPDAPFAAPFPRFTHALSSLSRIAIRRRLERRLT